MPPSHTARAPSRAPSRAHPTIPTCRISLWLDFLHATLVFAKEQRFSAAKVPTHHSPDAKSRRKTTNRSIAQGAGFVRPHPVARKPCGQRLGRERGCCGRWFKYTFLCAVVLECSLRCYRRAACFLPKLLLLSGTRVDQGNGTQRTLFAGKHTCQQMSHPRPLLGHFRLTLQVDVEALMAHARAAVIDHPWLIRTVFTVGQARSIWHARPTSHASCRQPMRYLAP